MIPDQENKFIEFWSNDQRFGLRIPFAHTDRMILSCIDSYPNETGGILVGYYNEKLNCATITETIFATSDSKKGMNWFFRGVSGIQKKLQRLWSSQRTYYLGEWHFHPSGIPVPSSVDITQMLEIASTPEAHCPEPILLIFSGTNDPKGMSYKSYIFSKNTVYELFNN